MSYDICLRCQDGELAQVPRQSEGGTYCVGGTTDAHLNATYNYCRLFRLALGDPDGVRWLYGKSGHNTIARLEKAVDALGTQRDDDYWKPTDGNVGHALSVLLAWARLHPGAVWEGD